MVPFYKNRVKKGFDLIITVIRASQAKTNGPN